MQSHANDLVRDGVVEEFWTNCRAAWARLPNTGLFLGLLAGWLLLFQFLGNGTFGYRDLSTPSLFQWMWRVYGSTMTDDGHGYVVPFVVLALFYWKREELLAVPIRSWWPGLILLAAALAFHVAAYTVQQPRVSIVALFAGIYAIMGIAWGPAWLRASFFPFVLFAFSVPLGMQGELVTFPLRLLVTAVVEFIGKNLLFFDVVAEGTMLKNSVTGYEFEVAAACSGIRSLFGIILLAVTYGYLLFRMSWRWWAMVAAALPLAVVGNVVRLLVIIIAAELGGEKGQEWGKAAHDSSFFSLVPYVPAFLGLWYLGEWLNRHHPSAKSDNSTPAKGSPP